MQNKCKSEGAKCESDSNCCEDLECREYRGIGEPVDLCQRPKQECKVEGESCFGTLGSCCAGLKCAFNKVLAQGVCESPKIELLGN